MKPIPPPPPPPPKPYDTEIEYLEGTGPQFINTRIAPFDGIGFRFILSITRSQAGNAVVFGCTENGIYTRGKGVGFDVGSQYYFYYGGNLTGYSTRLRPDEWYEVSMNYNNDGKAKINEWTSDLNMGNEFTSLFITFNKWNNGDMYSFGYCRFKEIIITDDVVPIFHGIPVRIGNIGYMYDKVSGELFGNSGTGDFILGPDIE